MPRRPAEIVLTDEEEAELKRWRRRRKTTTGLHFRAGIVLDCARGYSGEEVAERHATSQQTVTKWRRRFAADRLSGLSDAPRSGQPRRHGDDQVQDVLEATLNRRPKKATQWSVRTLAAELDIDPTFVHRVWRAFGLKPHLSTYSYWLNLVERFFASLAEHQLRRGTHRSVPALERAIRDYLDLHNEDPKPFRWTKSADDIIDSVNSVLPRINETGH